MSDAPTIIPPPMPTEPDLYERAAAAATYEARRAARYQESLYRLQPRVRARMLREQLIETVRPPK